MAGAVTAWYERNPKVKQPERRCRPLSRLRGDSLLAAIVCIALGGSLLFALLYEFFNQHIHIVVFTGAR